MRYVTVGLLIGIIFGLSTIEASLESDFSSKYSDSTALNDEFNHTDLIQKLNQSQSSILEVPKNQSFVADQNKHHVDDEEFIKYQGSSVSIVDDAASTAHPEKSPNSVTTTEKSKMLHNTDYRGSEHITYDHEGLTPESYDIREILDKTVLPGLIFKLPKPKIPKILPKIFPKFSKSPPKPDFRQFTLFPKWPVNPQPKILPTIPHLPKITKVKHRVYHHRSSKGFLDSETFYLIISIIGGICVSGLVFTLAVSYCKRQKRHDRQKRLKILSAALENRNAAQNEEFTSNMPHSYDQASYNHSQHPQTQYPVPGYLPAMPSAPLNISNMSSGMHNNAFQQ